MSPGFGRPNPFAVTATATKHIRIPRTPQKLTEKADDLEEGWPGVLLPLEVPGDRESDKGVVGWVLDQPN